MMYVQFHEEHLVLELKDDVKGSLKKSSKAFNLDVYHTQITDSNSIFA